MDQESDASLSDQQCRQCQNEFRRFLDEFTQNDDDAISQASQNGTETDHVYVAKAAEMFQFDRTTMDVDFSHLSSWDGDLADLTKEHHFRLEPFFRKVVQNFMAVHQRDFVETEEGVPKEFWVSFYNLPILERLRDLKTHQIGKLTAFAGTCTRTSEVRPSPGAARDTEGTRLDSKGPQTKQLMHQASNTQQRQDLRFWSGRARSHQYVCGT